MESFLDLAFYVGAFLVVFTVVVFVHEFGHYWVARRCGVRVVVFSVGFGRELYGWTDRSETRWRLSLIPLGGYVRFFGDGVVVSRRSDGKAALANGFTRREAELSGGLPEELEQLTQEERAISFNLKTPYQRFAIAAAGPMANFVLAIVLFAGLFMFAGRPVTPAVVEEVIADGAAEAAGLLPGDHIVEVGGGRIDSFERLRELVMLNPGTPMVVGVVRDGRHVVLDMTPHQVERTDRFGNVHRVSMIGVRVGGERVYERLDPFSALVAAVADTYSLVAMNLEGLGQILIGTRDTSELGGPIMIAQISGEVAKAGFTPVINFIVILSCMLGLINLLPIPPLDGGHLVFFAAEAVRGRPLGVRAHEYGYILGFMVVGTLMIVATYNDIARLPIAEFFRNVVG